MAESNTSYSFRHPSVMLKDSGTFGLELPEIPREIFISYASPDEAEAVWIESFLENYGFTVYRDRNEMDSGSHIPSQLEKAITDSRAVVVLLSLHAVTSDWVKRECALALKQEKLVACTLGPLDPGLLPEGMRDIHRTNLTGRNGVLPTTIELLRTLAHKLKRPEIAAIVMDAQRRRRLSEPRPLDAQGIEELRAAWRTLAEKPVVPEILAFFESKVKGSPLEEEFRHWLVGFGRYCGDEAWKWYWGVEGRVRDVARAMDYAKAGVAFEDERSPTVMGMIQRDGTLAPPNLELARQSFERAALMSDITGAKHLAWMLRNGEGGKEDVRAAASWFRRAAGGGDSGSMAEYANLSWKGLTDETDERVIRYWYTKSVLTGSCGAKGNLAYFLFDGIGGEQDRNRALTLVVEFVEELQDAAKGMSGYNLQNLVNESIALDKVKDYFEAGVGSEYVRNRARALIEAKQNGQDKGKSKSKKSKSRGKARDSDAGNEV